MQKSPNLRKAMDVLKKKKAKPKKTHHLINALLPRNKNTQSNKKHLEIVTVFAKCAKLWVVFVMSINVRLWKEWCTQADFTYNLWLLVY